MRHGFDALHREDDVVGLKVSAAKSKGDGFLFVAGEKVALERVVVKPGDS
jgi:hypothetical protein